MHNLFYCSLISFASLKFGWLSMCPFVSVFMILSIEQNVRIAVLFDCYNWSLVNVYVTIHKNPYQKGNGILVSWFIFSRFSLKHGLIFLQTVILLAPTAVPQHHVEQGLATTFLTSRDGRKKQRKIYFYTMILDN